MPWITTKVPAIASMRGRSFSGASSEIISSSTHIEQGLKPSSVPMASVNSGRPMSSSDSVRPRKPLSKRSGGAGAAAASAWPPSGQGLSSTSLGSAFSSASSQVEPAAPAAARCVR